MFAHGITTKALAGVCALLSLSVACGTNTSPHVIPNIVLIVFDDADTESVMAMPHIRRLVADAGTTFDRFYVTQPACCPSRASLLTGEYVHNHGVRANVSEDGGGFPIFLEKGHEERTIAKVLAQRGLRTGLFGKYLNQYGATKRSRRHRPPYWDRWLGKTDRGLNYRVSLNDDGRLRYYPRKTGLYSDEHVLGTALRWIGETNGGGRPAFAYIAPHAPHTPHDEPPGYATGFERTPFRPQDKPSFDEPDVDDKPPFLRSAPMAADVISRLRSDFVHRLRRMRVIDDFVGRLVDALETDGWLDRTYIFVTSDNGWFQGEHRLAGGKFIPYEEATRVPLIVRGPGVRTGTHIDRLTSMIDLYPTLAELAGAASDRDGRSLVPLFSGRRVAWRTRLLIESWLSTEEGLPGHSSTLVTNGPKFTQWSDGTRELYDLEADPYELENIASTTGERQLSGLVDQLSDLSRCEGETCRRTDGGP